MNSNSLEAVERPIQTVAELKNWLAALADDQKIDVDIELLPNQ